MTISKMSPTFLLLAAVLWPWTVKGQPAVVDSVLHDNHRVYYPVPDSQTNLTRSDIKHMIDSAIQALWEMRVDTIMYTSGFCDTGYVFYAVPETTWVFVRPKEGKP